MVELRVLRRSDDRSQFRCGDEELDRFFRRYAGQNQFRHHLGVTYVAVAHDRPIAFATVAASQIEIADLPPGDASRLPRYPLPVLRLARMAVHEAAQGHGVGKLLLRCVFQIAHEMAESVGCVGVVVDAKPGAIDFYAKLGFRMLKARVGLLGDRPEPEPMYAHLSAIPKT